MMKPPFGVARVVSIYIYPFPGVKVTETNRGCLKKSTIQWCLAKVDGVRSGSGKTTMYMGYWGKKRNKSQFRHFGDVPVYHRVSYMVHVVSSTMPTFHGFHGSWNWPPVSLCSSLSPENTHTKTLFVLSTKHVFVLPGSLPPKWPSEVFAAQMIQIQWCS